MGRQQTLHGITVGSREHQMEMIRGLEALGIRPAIDTSLPLESIRDALQFQQSGSHFGKICLSY